VRLIVRVVRVVRGVLIDGVGIAAGCGEDDRGAQRGELDEGHGQAPGGASAARHRDGASARRQGVSFLCEGGLARAVIGILIIIVNKVENDYQISGLSRALSLTARALA